VTSSVWLSPCEWGLNPVSIMVSSTQPTASVTLVMKKGVGVPIRVHDSSQALLQNEGKVPGAHLLLGINNDALGFRQATLIGQDSGGRNYQVLIRFGAKVNLVSFSSFFKLSSVLGAAFPNNAVNVPILVPTGQSPTLLEFQIIASNK
jgi:hypothetical protein